MWEWSAVASRWLHVGGAIVLLGGAVMLRYVVAPAAEALPDAEHQAFRQRLMAGWRKFVHPLVGVLFLSGCWNFWLRLRTVSPWNALAGFHALLGLYVLFIASALVGRSAGLAKLRQDWKFWLQLNIAAAFVAVMLGGMCRFLPAKPSEPAKAEVSAAS